MSTNTDLEKQRTAIPKISDIATSTVSHISSIDSTQVEFKLAIKNKALWGGLILTALSTIGVSFVPSVTIQAILQCVSGGLTLTGLFYVITNLRLLSKVNVYNIIAKDQEFAIKKRNVAIDFISEWESIDMWKARKFEFAMEAATRDKQDIKQDHDNLLSKLKDYGANSNKNENSEILRKSRYLRNDMVMVLNFFEKMEIAIKAEVADEAVLQNFFMTTIYKYYCATELFVKEESSTNKRSWFHFAQLAARWGQP